MGDILLYENKGERLKPLCGLEKLTPSGYKRFTVKKRGVTNVTTIFENYYIFTIFI